MARPKIDIPKERIAEFCHRHHIRTLSLFGSVLRDDFRPDSDVDVLVEFEPGHVPGLAFFAMEEELSEIFGRNVDLVHQQSVEQSKNYIRRKNILESLQTIYAAR